MIVVDSNVIAYLYLPGEFTVSAEKLLQREPEWAAPLLWRSELRNILALSMRKRLLTFERAFQIQREAEALLADNEYDVDSFEVLELARDSGCTAYDCEFVALAKRLGVKLFTVDTKLRKSFPNLTSPLSANRPST
ncbi:MAG: type II toxin-antitoxin system VapC family toxin [Pseudomonadota bacterium]|nr:type II toxin-antitoxin system VapC family toxin [Pseudomonadota bacterium]